MKIQLKEKRLSSLHLQRNVLAGLALTLLGTCVLQTTLLFFRSEKTIIHPPELKQSYWVEGNKFAPSYLEEMALYYTHLLLDVSESTILYQGDILLRYVTSKAHGSFKSKLYEDHQRLKKENLSLHFVPFECQVFPDQLAVEVTGDLHGYVSSKKVSQHRETYRLEFTASHGRLFISAFRLIKSDQKEDAHENS